MKLKELSERLGLSQTTVSRALNGYPEVKEETRRRVLEAAQRHHYHADARARSLATGRALAIGHVIPISRHEMVNPVFTDFIAGAGETYSRAGYDMRLSVVDQADEARTYRTLAARRSVDGVIVHGPLMHDDRIDLLRELRLPFVVHGRPADDAEEGCDYTWLDVNNEGAFRRATDFLLDLGHERIGLVNGLESMTFAWRRRCGYEAALRARGIEPVEALMCSDEMSEPHGYASVMRMLRLGNPPSAFLLASVVSAIGARRAVQELKLRLGVDVSLMTFDDDLSYLRNTGKVPMFTATRSSVRDAGARCAQLVLELVRDPAARPRQELWEAELIVGNSTGPALPVEARP